MEGRFNATEFKSINKENSLRTEDFVRKSAGTSLIRNHKFLRDKDFERGFNSTFQRDKMREFFAKNDLLRETRTERRRTAKRRTVRQGTGRPRKERRRCWRYDAVSWTLKQIRPNCKVPKGIRKQNTTIKRIIYFNKTIEYTVCNKTSRKCKEQPYYSWRLKLMIERPPCCIDHVLETFKHVTSILDKAKIPYFLTAGGLVGWVRNKSMPRYENDIDILIDEMHWGRYKAHVMTKAAKYGHYPKEKFRNFIRIYYSTINKVFVDTWPYRVIKKNGKKWVKAVSLLTWHENPYSSIFPLKRSRYSGIPVWVPNDPKDVLDRHYGKRFNWRKEVTCKTNFKKKCTS